MEQSERDRWAIPPVPGAAAEVFGASLAQAMQLNNEYHPAPPFQSGLEKNA
jgi:hypothetical protein